MPLETSPSLTEVVERNRATGPRRSAGIRAEQIVKVVVWHIFHTIARVWLVLRFGLFIVYLLVGLITVWVWIGLALIGLVYFTLRAVTHSLLWLSGGVAPRSGPPRTVTESIRHDLQAFWDERVIAYGAVMRPLARGYVRAKEGLRTFWYWHLLRKAVALTFAFVIVGIPAMYLVPRTHYVQITDDNALHYEGTQVMYLVHGLDLFNPGKTREYMNEDAWWFGKINSQGLKAQLQIGHSYRLRVVGLRWYWKPRLFPNIIRATEVDDQGHPIDEASRIGVPVTPPAAPVPEAK
jgi:hypothetical protein